eukprot:CAMPEP_0176423824 /NCGR_PEP_ID=MMETSP0127-20121128/10499_1 /TAXON_ID=938130 /ORGANISM="Platyophrya macrostoma, Strain WH" /LENGTH=492 /DNA_ID=CAMNT_0017804819 /DNA_START=74 /DNA_END=1552 /DNA_ORIENTATION=+
MNEEALRGVVLPHIQSLRKELDSFYTQQKAELALMHKDSMERMETVRRLLRAQIAACQSSSSSSGALPGSATAAANAASMLLVQHRQRNQPSSQIPVVGGGSTVGGFISSLVSGSATPSTPPRHHAAAPKSVIMPPSLPPGLFSHTAEDTDGAGSGSDAAAAWAGNTSSHSNTGGTAPLDMSSDVISTPPPHGSRRMLDSNIMGSPQSIEKVPVEQFLGRMYTQASNSPPINFETLYEQLAGKDDSPQLPSSLQFSQPAPFDPPSATDPSPSRALAMDGIPLDSFAGMRGQHQTRGVQVAPESLAPGGRLKVVPIPGGGADDPTLLDIDPAARCQVLVEFKRRRVLQFESHSYVAPGEYVVVGGDRGEDIGLVIYTLCETKSKTVKGVALSGAMLARSIGVGTGVVLRLAKETEIIQLLSMQTELERRAVEVCMQRVLEHGLPMVIVDAEYQFDKKKLTFYYEAQQRMDFRELVRDLFKTFRARIWMELVEN